MERSDRLCEKKQEQEVIADPFKSVSKKYCPRFGQIAVELGFITEAQLTEALSLQVNEELSGKGHRLLGSILFEKGWMSGPQVDQVMTELFKRKRRDEN